MVALSTPIACLLWAVACCTFEVCAQAAHIPMADPLPASCGPCRVRGERTSNMAEPT